MKMPLNKQQEKVNDTHNKNVIVSASAGTGKTTTLTARLIDYIKEGNSIDDYLVVSFTEAAANELKDRVMSALKKAMQEDSDKIEHYRKEIAKIPLANISTIHAFCLEVIKKYGYVLGVDPAIAGKLADDGKLRELKDEAFKIAIRGKEQNKLVYRYADRPEDLEDLQKEIEGIDRFFENLTDPENWKLKQENLYESLKNKDFSLFPEDIGNILSTNIKAIEEAHKRNYEIATFYCDENKPKNLPKSIQDVFDLNTLLSVVIPEIKTNLKEKKYYEAVCQADNLPDKYPELSRLKLEEEISCEVKENREIYKNSVETIKEYHLTQIVAEKNIKTVKQLFMVCNTYRKEYNRLKAENDVIGYEDMLSKAEEILTANNGMVANIYKTKFKEIMVDEYQDTNQIQENIIRTIGRDNNIFRVGDIKQSIYKFQNAKPEMMRNLINNKGKNDEVLQLSENYRSSKSIIDFSNYIFNRLMNIKAGTYVPEYDNLVIPEVNINKNGDMINLITVPFKKDDNPEEYFKAKYKTKEIGNYIASEMIALKQRNSKLKWSDFVILVRANTRKGELKRILNEHNIPVYTTAKTGFFADPAVSGVISLLNLIEKYSKLNKVSVLSSPLFGYSYDDIANMLWEEKEEYKERLNNKGLSELDAEINNDEERLKRNTNKKQKDLDDLLEFLREYRKDHTPIEVLNYIYNFNNFYMENVNSYQRSNLDSLYQLVLDYRNESGSIKDLLTYLSSNKKVDKEEASSFTSKDDVVQIMTIHQSKGLEFEYVFIADLAFKYNYKKDSKCFCLNEQLGVAPKYISEEYKIEKDNPFYEKIKDKTRTEEFEEELRVLYVAVTRAKTGLYVVGGVEYEEDKIDFTSKDLFKKGMSIWIRKALENAPNEIMKIVNIKDLSEEELHKHEKVSEKLETNKFSDEKYSKNELIKKESEMVNPSKEEDRKLNVLIFYKESGSERGTLMHKATELLGVREVTKEDIDGLPFELSDEDKKMILAFYEHPFTISIRNNKNESEYPFIAYLKNDGSQEELNSLDDSFSVNSNIANGTIDLLSVDEKNAYIIDFKSDKNTNKNKLIKRYSGQLNLYEDIVKREFPDKEIKKMIYSFEMQDYVEL